MKKLLNEVKRMKKIAGIISEGQYEEGRDDRAKKLEKIALKVYDKIENSVEVEDDMLWMSKREIAEFVPKGAPVKAIVDLVHSYMRGNMPLPDDFEDDRPEFDYEDDPDRMVYERGADMAKSEEITMEGDEVNEARGGQLQPIDPAALKKVIALGVKSEVLSPQDVSYLMKRFAAIPVLVNKAIAGDEKAYYDVMAGGDWPDPEYSNADDKRLAKYYEKLSDLMAAVDAVMYEGELEVIPSRWNKLKAHIEGMR